jgi:hypothetical protein
MQKQSNPKTNPQQGPETGKHNFYPEQIPEALGDQADQANLEIDQELQENIRRARQTIDPARNHYKEDEAQ